MDRWWLILDGGDVVAQVCAEDAPATSGGQTAVEVPRRGDLRAEVFDDVTNQWLPNLVWHRALAWTRIKASRDAVESGGCVTPLGRVDTDALSRDRVAGAVQLAMIAGGGFVIDWTMEDNSVVSHDHAEMIAMGVAVGLHVAGIHALARGLRADIEAAADASELAAIEWPS